MTSFISYETWNRREFLRLTKGKSWRTKITIWRLRRAARPLLFKEYLTYLRSYM